MNTSNAYKSATSQLCGRLIAPYQREGVLWMLTREFDKGKIKGGFLCDEMGLGKTVQLITTMLGNPQDRTLIVVPKTIITQWQEEIEHFAPEMKVMIYERGKTVQEMMDHQVVLAPYSLMIDKGEKKGHRTIFHQIVWNRIILDEAHEIRNPKSKIFGSISTLKSSIRWVVTGTPVFNSMKDFVTLCLFLGIPKEVTQGRTDEVRSKFVIRRTKMDVSKYNCRIELPPCDFENVELDMYPEEKAVYVDVFDDGKETMRDIIKNSQGNLAMHAMAILEMLLRCRQAMIHPQLVYDGIARKTEQEVKVWEHKTKKFEYLLDSIKSHPKEKSIVFCQFTTEMDLIHEMLRDEHIKVFRIDGSVSNEQRKNQRIGFTKCDTGCVFIIQIKAGGVGLNLQAATRVYITAPSWNPATELQAIGRSHRTGQTKKVVVKKLIYKGYDNLHSVEEAMLTLQKGKSIVCAKVLNDERLLEQIPTNTKSTISIQDVRKIFQV